MQAITGFSLGVTCSTNGLRNPLYFNHQDTSTFIAGQVIEAQYSCTLPNGYAGYLVVTSFNCPFEESTEFSLLDEAFKLVATTSLAQAYGSLLLYAHWPVANNRLRLHYYGQFVLDLTISSSRFWLNTQPKLTLSEVVDPQSDPRTAASMAELDQRLAAIDKSL